MIRAEVEDRPGALALLAQECGKAEVNILRLWVHPPGEGSGDGSTDDLVVDAPDALDAVPPQAAKDRAIAPVSNRDTAFFHFLILNSSLPSAALPASITML